jgi:tetratricopeptide (TPR) repeat protein
VIFQLRVRLMRQKPDRDEAGVERLLRETLAKRDDAEEALREVARRELARLWATSRDYRRYREALSLTADIVRDAPHEDEAWAVRAEVCKAHLGHWPEAIEALRRLQASPNPAVRAEAFSDEARVHELRRRWNDEAVALTSLHQLAPNQPEIVIRLLWNAVRRKDTAAATEFRREAGRVTSDPTLLLMADVLSAYLSDDRSVVVAAVVAARNAGRISPQRAFEWLTLLQADNECDALLKQALDPRQPETLARYALFLAAHNRVSDALAQLSELWKAGPRDATIATAAGLTGIPHVLPDDLQALRASVVKLAAADDAPARLLTAAAALEDHAGRHAAAIALYRRALAKAPDDVMVLNNLAFLESLVDGAPADACLELMRRALELAGPNDQFLDTEGVVLLRRGEAEAARERFQRAWDIRPETNYRVHLAWALTELGRFDEAAQAFGQADAADSPPRLHPLERPFDAAWRRRLVDKHGETGRRAD